MFTIYHIIWLVICISIIAVAIIHINKHNPKFDLILNFAVITCIASELIKILSTLKMVEGSDGQFHPYIELNQLPFHLCSIQLILIFICKFSKKEELKKTIYAFMYPTCTIGAAFAILLPSIFNTTVPVTRAFTHPIPYQMFLYHAMLIILGYSIFKYKGSEFKRNDYFKTMGILGLFGFISLYLNSIFASPVYENGKLKYVEFAPNFFFTYETPIGLELTEMWQWYIYLAILIVLAFGLIALFYIPVFKRERNEKKE